MAVLASVMGLNVAQPQLAQTLNASQSDVIWIINIYAITLAALLMALGTVGDRWGRKPVLMIGLTTFGAAMIMPVTLSVITSTLPESERSKAIGIWSGVAAGGGILGMFLSTVLVDTVDWRWLFALPIVLAIVSALISIQSIPNARERSEHSFDTIGAILSMFTVIGLIVFLHEGPKHGWASPRTLTGLGFGLAAIIAFALREIRHPAPLLDIRLFRQRRLTSGSVTLLTSFGVLAGVFILLYPYFQAVLGWSGLRSTIASLPMMLLMMGSSSLAPLLAAKIKARLTMATGMALSGAGLALMATFVSVDGGYLSVLPGMMAMGLGMGLSMTPSTEAITLSLPRDQQGVASALNDVTREFGTALGVVLLGAVFIGGYSSVIETKLAGVSEETAQIARMGIASVLLIGDQAPELLLSVQDAFVQAWRQAMWAGVVVMALLLVFVLLRGPENSTPSDEGNTDAL